MKGPGVGLQAVWDFRKPARARSDARQERTHEAGLEWPNKLEQGWSALSEPYNSR